MSGDGPGIMSGDGLATIDEDETTISKYSTISTAIGL